MWSGSLVAGRWLLVWGSVITDSGHVPRSSIGNDGGAVCSRVALNRKLDNYLTYTCCIGLEQAIWLLSTNQSWEVHDG